MVPLADDAPTGESTYDQILGAVADLDLPLHRLDQRRHRVAELFAGEASNVADTTGVIHDIGYQRYQGARLGRGYARALVYVHGLRTAFGLGRSAKAKIFPWIVAGLAGLVAVVFTAIRTQSPGPSRCCRTGSSRTPSSCS